MSSLPCVKYTIAKEFDPWIRELPLERLRADLTNKIGTGKVGRGRDIDLTVGLIGWVNNLPGCDASAYLFELLGDGRIMELSHQLQRIPSVGEKISSFILRDFVLGLEFAGRPRYQFRSVEEYLCAFPVDAHVDKAALELGLGPASKEVLADAVVRLCRRHESSPLLVDQAMFGLNYLKLPLGSVLD